MQAIEKELFDLEQFYARARAAQLARVKKTLKSAWHLCAVINKFYMEMVRAVAWTSFAGVGVFMLIDALEKHGIHLTDILATLSTLKP